MSKCQSLSERKAAITLTTCYWVLAASMQCENAIARQKLLPSHGESAPQATTPICIVMDNWLAKFVRYDYIMAKKAYLTRACSGPA